VNSLPSYHEETTVSVMELDMDTVYVATLELLFSNVCVFKITGSDVTSRISAEVDTITVSVCAQL